VTGCPVRKLEPGGRATGPALEHVDDADGERWVVRSFAVARQVLRDPEATAQAGFGAEQGANGSRGGTSGSRGQGGAVSPSMRPPILYLEGTAHRTQRSAAARFFAPRVVEGYRPMMESVSQELVGRLRHDRDLDLRQLAMELAVQVVARVVGLADSSTRGMSRRLDTFFAGDLLNPRRTPLGLLRKLRSGTALARFYYLDVKPAIRSRRRRPQEDVVSQLLADGFSDLEVLTECLTYAAAGMATTRELICMAAWHLLDDPELLARYRAGGPDERGDLLSETLRLEPVVGHLYRRLRQPLLLEVDGEEHELPVGALVDLDLRAVNADASTVGEEPYGLCPGRELPRTVPAAVMGFGDGHHRCPGGPIAILETEIFLTALFDREVAAAGPPRVHWNPVSQGYDLDQLWVRAAA
jgi:cytochrome P450